MASSASTSGSRVPPPAGVGPQAVGIDIGGTKIAAGVVTEDGTILDRTRVPTPPDDEAATLAALLAVVDELGGRNPRVEAIGLGAAGLVEWPGGHARWAPHNTYRRLELRRLLHERTGLPTVVDNDANAAAWAEARFGAGAGTDDLVLVAVGTGVGGGLVLDGAVYRDDPPRAAELARRSEQIEDDLMQALERWETLGQL